MMDAPVSYDWVWILDSRECVTLRLKVASAMSRDCQDPDLSAAQQVGRWFEQGQ